MAVKYDYSQGAIRTYIGKISDCIKKYTIDSGDEFVGEIQGQVRELLPPIRKLLKACDKFLTDCENPDEYNLGPRDHDIEVTYTDWVDVPNSENKKPVQRKAMLSELLEKTGRDVTGTRYKIADPRELVLKAADRLDALVAHIGRLTGEEKVPQGPTFNGPTQINIDGLPLLLGALESVPCECGRVVDAREWVKRKLIGVKDV